MAYEAKVLEVMIASPSDVADERQIVREIISEWNVLNSRDRKTVIMPIGWEIHSSPDLSGRPQQIINDRVLTHADILVGIFWTRLGSPTGKAASGTVEEIEEHLSKNKPVMLYFSDTPVALKGIDRDQYDKLQEFKTWAVDRGLIETYESKDEFRNKFRRNLAHTMPRFIEKKDPDPRGVFIGGLPLDLTPEAEELLMAAAADENGLIGQRSSLSGESVSVGRTRFTDGTPRSIALWRGALDELIGAGYVDRRSENISKVNHKGYSYVDTKLPKSV